MRRPTFQRLLMLARGFVLATGSHTVAAALLAGDLARGHHHEAFHRFFSRRCWSPDALGRLLLLRLVALLGAASLTVAIDDTLAPKKGPKVFGLGTHLDPVRSTRRHRIFAFGHVWVVLAVLVKLPMTSRPWALPILFRLYRNERECAKRGDPYRKKTELAREMLDELLSWTELPVRVVADIAYCNATLQRGHDKRVVFVGTMRPDAVLTALPTAPQRKKTGRLEHGRIPFRAFFSSDPDLDAVDILETYAGRWSIEVAFRNLEQHLGFADSPARLRRAVERTAPFVGLLYTSLVLWFLEHAADQPLALVPVRTWYRHKATLSFEDVLRAARTDLLLTVSDPLRPSDNLKNCPDPSKSPSVYRPRP